MSAPHIILDCYCHLCAKKYQIWWKFDEVMTKTILLVFSETRCRMPLLIACRLGPNSDN